MKEGCDCTELCEMGPTCPGGMLARVPGAGCARTACRHCGKQPDADGDHSCPCPYTDADCPDHPSGGWLRRELERALNRRQQVPAWARPVLTPDRLVYVELPCYADGIPHDRHIWDFGSGEQFLCPGTPEDQCACGCTRDMHIWEIGCPCALPGEPPCDPS